MNVFMRASRIRLRFTTNKGKLPTEDMWDLPLVVLRKMANDINRLLKILMEIIEQRESDKSASVLLEQTAQRRKLLRELIAKKKLDKLGDSELDVLEKELESL